MIVVDLWFKRDLISILNNILPNAVFGSYDFFLNVPIFGNRGGFFTYGVIAHTYSLTFQRIRVYKTEALHPCMFFQEQDVKSFLAS